jgi:hypothetical protein
MEWCMGQRLSRRAAATPQHSIASFLVALAIDEMAFELGLVVDVGVD